MGQRKADQFSSYIFHEGSTIAAYEYLGAHPAEEKGEPGYVFRVWAPNAASISVVGDFNDWDRLRHPMEKIDHSLWEAFVPGLKEFDVYKFSVEGPDGELRLKSDPYAFHFETRPGNGSKLYDIRGYQWGDEAWRRHCAETPIYSAPMNTYEVHLGSWRQRDNGDFIDYRDMAHQLAAYVKDLGYNYIELLPVTEHPLDDSWGYQCTGYYAPTSRFGVPKDFMYFVDHLHQNGIGIILDWVPAHFCKDEHGLYEFDGGSCYEYSDPLRREHKSWGTHVFDYARPEVRSFLLSSAAFWLKEYHIDGIRVDAVASMLYLDYDRREGEWSPNQYGGKEHIEAIDFLRDLNKTAFSVNPNVLMIAEESTAWPLVTKPGDTGGLGFNLKWNMGWMNDMCHYLKMDPWFRQYNHKDITFSMMYAFSENYVLPISHDEVVHMKGSVFGKMPGDSWQKFAGVRGFYAYMLAHPGKKLSFMGMELGTEEEWAFYKSLDWSLLEKKENRQLFDYMRSVNHFYLNQSPLWEVDFDWQGFEWLVSDDNSNNVVVFLRRDKAGKILLCVVNFSPNAYEGYRFGCPPVKEFVEVFNSDAPAFGGSGVTNDLPAKVEWVESHGKECSVAIRVPPLGAAFFEASGKLRAKPKPRTAKKASDGGEAIGETKPVRRGRPPKAKEPAKRGRPPKAKEPAKRGRPPKAKESAGAAEKKRVKAVKAEAPEQTPPAKTRARKASAAADQTKTTKKRGVSK